MGGSCAGCCCHNRGDGDRCFPWNQLARIVGRPTARTLKGAAEVGGGNDQGLAALGAEQGNAVSSVHRSYPRIILLGRGGFCVALIEDAPVCHVSPHLRHQRTCEGPVSKLTFDLVRRVVGL